MTQSITMDGAGRIVVPSEVRRQLGLVAGSTLSIDVVAQRIELTPQPRADADLLVRPGKRTVLRASGKAFDAAAATRAERDSQARRAK
jgi:AbrB family looped-hinge helix DNA binding protein